MQAIRNPEPRHLEPVSPRSLRHKRTTAIHAHRRQQALIFELSIKLGTNVLLSAVAIATLVNLLPQHFSQQKKLAEIRHEVAEAQYRVDILRSNFNRDFDPQQSQSIMQEQSTKIDPQQRRIIWTKKPIPVANQTTTAPNP